jgi:hypothetical protein
MDRLRIRNQAMTLKVYAKLMCEDRKRDGARYKLDRNRAICNPWSEEEGNLLYIFLQSFFHILV